MRGTYMHMPRWVYSTKLDYKALCLIRLLTVRRPAYTFPGGDPKIRDTIASRAILIFWKDPSMCIFLGEEECLVNEPMRMSISNSRVSKNNTGSTRIFDCELRFAILSCNATWDENE